VNAAYLLDRGADTHGAARAVVVPGADRTWAELRDRVRRLAGGLQRRGVGTGTRVALLSPNTAEMLEAYLALAWLGAIVVPINTRLAPHEITVQLEDAGAALGLVDASLCALAADAAPGLERIVMPGATVPHADDRRSWAALGAAAPAGAPVPLGADDALGIFYTGGTTGPAKGVVLTHGNVLANAAHVALAAGFERTDVQLHAAPMFHLADLGYCWTMLLVGGAHAFLPHWSPAAFLATVERTHATFTLLAPAMIGALVRAPELARHDLSSVRRLMYGGAPITEDTLRRALATLPCELWQGYGQTEATHTICTLTAADHRRAPAHPELLRSCGRPVIGVHVRVVDAGDRPVAPGATGEIIVRAPTVMRGYWNRPDETAETLRGGWLRTGDLATVDDAGYVYLLDRRKDMIITGGENVYSAEVENVLAAHPAVLEAAVIAVPDDAWGERVHAVVVLAPGRSASEAELVAHCRRFIGGYKLPRSFEFRAALPRTSAGKVQKSALREPYWAGRARQVH
jgi:long-chain acyl-CoA synthetase